MHSQWVVLRFATMVFSHRPDTALLCSISNTKITKAVWTPLCRHPFKLVSPWTAASKPNLSWLLDWCSTASCRGSAQHLPELAQAVLGVRRMCATHARASQKTHHIMTWYQNDLLIFEVSRNCSDQIVLPITYIKHIFYFVLALLKC